MTLLATVLFGLSITLGQRHGAGMQRDASHMAAMAQAAAHAATIHDACLAVPTVVLAQHAVKRTQIASAGRLVRIVAWDARMSVEGYCAYEMAGYRRSLHRARAYQAKVQNDVARATAVLWRR